MPEIDRICCADLSCLLTSADTDQTFRLIVAESLMRSFEVKKMLVDKFRKSRNGVNWVADSTNEVLDTCYLNVALGFKHLSETTGDLRYLNSAMKMFENKCTDVVELQKCVNIAVDLQRG